MEFHNTLGDHGIAAMLNTLFARRRNRPDPTRTWRRILATLTPDKPYRERLDAMLAVLHDLICLEAYAIYRLTSTGDRFMLEHAFSSLDPGSALVPAGGSSAGDNALITARALALDFPRTDEDDEPRLLRADIGLVYSAPLRHNGTLIGLLHMGPVPSEGAYPALRQTVEPILPPLVVGYLESKQAEELRERLRAIEARSQASKRLLASAFELDDFLVLLLQLALQATATDAGFVATADAAGHLAVRVEENMAPDFATRVNLVPGEGLFDFIPEAEALVIRDHDFVQALGWQSTLAVPLIDEGQLVGIFGLVNYQSTRTFADYSLHLLTTFAEQITLVLRNVPLLKAFSERYLDTVRALARSVDLRNPGTVGHAERVGQVADALAAHLGLLPHERELLKVAAELHDVGACGIAEVGASLLTDINHPTIGADLIRLALPGPVAEAVAAHHEWHDGWGFPNGLKGDEISPLARILALAEFATEETTPWGEVRAPLTLDRLREEIRRRTGSQFHPQVAEAFHLVVADVTTGRRTNLAWLQQAAENTHGS